VAYVGHNSPFDTTMMKAVGYDSTVVITMVEAVGHNHPSYIKWFCLF